MCALILSTEIIINALFQLSVVVLVATLQFHYNILILMCIGVLFVSYKLLDAYISPGINKLFIHPSIYF